MRQSNLKVLLMNNKRGLHSKSWKDRLQYRKIIYTLTLFLMKKLEKIINIHLTEPL